MNNQKIPLKKLDAVDLEVLNEAAHYYLGYLRAQVQHKKTAQAHIHCAILSSYGFEIYKKLCAHQKDSGLKLAIFTAFVALDSLQYYLDSGTPSSLHQAKCSRLIQELDSALPATSDGKVFTINSEL
ncbi:hypothetical protein SAMN04487764_1532 [Gillisia sp. Hel1_33_143]|uniref:hypothetical protein n=1 Tax=Gillisia sp. Hel1_33_143 TaxID=1336796 RepID=UPI00087C964B|nr:hypothetical protein [Gillisia sp. Hel1_33_143]SDS13566.1 hypothetical protein SAMN04487764_1532 [Gillisia sp. Hel1_33_143]